MDRQAIEKASNEVYRQHPEISGEIPSVQEQGTDRFLLIFKGKAITANGKEINNTVRAVCDSKGKILKLTSSR